MPSLIILTTDARLGRVLADEAALYGMPALVCADAQGIDKDAWERASIVIADLDSKLVGSIPEHVRVLGLCRDPESLSPRARRLAHVLLCRPFCMADLRAEIGMLGSTSPREVPAPEQTRFSELALLEESRCVLMGNRQISLTDKEFAVFSLLVKSGASGVSKQALAELLDCEGSNEAQVYICHLRRKLEDAFGVRLIKTVRGVGYVYVGLL